MSDRAQSGRMTRERWALLEPLVDAALDLAPDQRSAFYDEVATNDPELRAELEARWTELAARSVGLLALNEVRDLVTKSLLSAALVRSHDNYSRAAQLLGITRQAVQYLVQRHAAGPRGGERSRKRRVSARD